MLVAFVGSRVVLRRARPLLADGFHLPTKTTVDGRLLAGAAIFGIGWGIGGFCPGPAVASLSVGIPQTVLFVLAMLIGMTLYDRVWSTRT